MEITIREKQTDIDNEDENMSIFTRISKIHREINDMAASGFMTTMRKYPAVRHPIVKTNAIGKNRHYKACHKLWNYIHSYDRVGYKIDLVKSEPVITREFEKDIYNSFLWDYFMLQNFVEEATTIDVERAPRQKEITVKYIRQALDEIIRGLDMSDSNVRKLIMSELADLQKKRRAEKESIEALNNSIKKRGKNNEEQ